MLFVINESNPVETFFHMHNVPFPLDMIFMDDEFKVLDVKRGNPEDDKIEGIASYVLEVNADSGIKIGDEADLEDEAESSDVDKSDNKEGKGKKSSKSSSKEINRQDLIMIVDDDKDLCEYVSKELSENYKVITSNSGNEAWNTLLV